MVVSYLVLRAYLTHEQTVLTGVRRIAAIVVTVQNVLAVKNGVPVDEHVCILRYTTTVEDRLVKP